MQQGGDRGQDLRIHSGSRHAVLLTLSRRVAQRFADGLCRCQLSFNSTLSFFKVVEQAGLSLLETAFAIKIVLWLSRWIFISSVFCVSCRLLHLSTLSGSGYLPQEVLRKIAFRRIQTADSSSTQRCRLFCSARLSHGLLKLLKASSGLSSSRAFAARRKAS